MNTSETRKMIFCAMLPIFILLQAVHVLAGEYCPYDYSTSYYYPTRYCTYGCCGSKYSDYSDVCCSNSYSYTSYSSSRSEVPVGIIVGSVIGGVAGLSILIGIIKCCCVAINNSSRRTGTVIQPANTAMQTCVVNTTALSQGQSITPVQQGAAYPSAGPPPPYVQVHNVS